MLQADVAGLKVLITAGAAGIGLAMVESFSKLGAEVFACDVDDAALAALAESHPQVGQIRADVSDPAQVDALFDAALERFGGGLDVLVNNAGIAGPTANVEDVAHADLRRTLEVNVEGMFHCLRRAVPVMKAAGAGCIVNLSSAAGVHGFPLRTPYAASKWAVVGLTKSLAKELGPHGIRVNALCPGAVEGARIDRVIAAKAEAKGMSFEEMHAIMAETTSLRTFVSAQDIADMALYLASPAGARISAQALSIDGGVEVLR
jgi:NAD(P)-dependent dehydrogenase (short-subunit alcohol dehydrogenase family)